MTRTFSLLLPEIFILPGTHVLLMCGRFSIAVRIGIFARRFGIEEPIDCALPRYNIAPSENVPVVFDEGANRKVLMMRWGLIPSWTKRPGQGPNPINARAEGLSDNNLYRDLIARGRCLVPATGFYEWRTEGAKKTPFYISKKDKSLFTMAGLYDTWKDPDGNEVRSFTVVTTIPNELVAPLHDRMPAILSSEGEENWAGRRDDITGIINDLLVPYPSGQMESFEVARSVNNPANKTEAAVTRVRQGTLAGY
ncbi:MAG TPA: SOS response-associated peptidase [Methanoregulaceae archaeon]|nr:SOS response-associated peptidase [Methanoregulaceae archaeon]